MFLRYVLYFSIHFVSVNTFYRFSRYIFYALLYNLISKRDSVMSKVSANIKSNRIEKGMSQSDLAKLLDVKPATISAWEVGRNEPDIGALSKMAEIFDTTIDALVGRPPNIDGISADLAALIGQFADLTAEDKRAVLTVVAALRGKSRPSSGTDGFGESSAS